MTCRLLNVKHSYINNNVLLWHFNLFHRPYMTFNATAMPYYYYNCTRTNNAGTCVARDVYPQKHYIRACFCRKYIVVPYTYRVIWTFAKAPLRLGDTRFLRREKRLRKIPHDNNDNYDNNNDNIVIYFYWYWFYIAYKKKMLWP